MGRPGSRFTQLKDAAESIAALSNHPRVLIGAARLYRELLVLPPKGPWEAILLSDGEKFAAGLEAAQRGRYPDQGDPNRELGHFGRP